MNFLNSHTLTTLHNFSSEDYKVFACQGHYWKQCKVKCQFSPWEIFLIVNIFCSNIFFSFDAVLGEGVGWFCSKDNQIQLFPLATFMLVLTLSCIWTRYSLSSIDSLCFRPYAADLIYSFYLEEKIYKWVPLSKKGFRFFFRHNWSANIFPWNEKIILPNFENMRGEACLSLACYQGQATTYNMESNGQVASQVTLDFAKPICHCMNTVP